MNLRSPVTHNRRRTDLPTCRPGTPRTQRHLALLIRVVLTVAVLALVARPAVAGAQAQGQAPDASKVEILRGVTFGGNALAPLTLNVYKPVAATLGRPAVILVHGGSWTQGNPDMMDVQGKLLAQQGWVGFSVSYRLATAGNPTWPGNADDIRSAVRWVGEHARDYGADPTRIALMGESAGGHLAAVVGTTGFDPQPVSADEASRLPRIRAVATLSAPLDLAQLMPDGPNPPASCGDDEPCRIFWRLPLVAGMLGCEPNQCPDTYAKASPPQQVTKATPPMYLANSTEEIIPVGQLDTMAAALGRQGIPVLTQRIEGSKHGNELTPKVWNQMVPFLADSLGVPTPQPIQFVEERELKDYLLIIFIGMFAIGLLFVFILAAVRGRWDEPGA